MSDILEKLKETELSILKETTDLLEKNDIQYFLACGTLLGAIRHNGFIPWDDDIDIYCFGKDYERIVKAFSNYNGEIKLCDPINTPDYPYWFPKVVYKNSVLVEDEFKNKGFNCGVYIDIFPMMDLPKNPVNSFYVERKRYFYYGLLKAYYLEKKDFFSKLARFFAHFFSPSKTYKKLMKLYSKSLDDATIMVDTGVFDKQAYLSKKDFSGFVYHGFEKYSFRIPKGYDHYLLHYYGNYMNLPPEEKRVSNHNFVFLEIDGKVLIDKI